MRKILLLITDLKIGGTPTVVRELAIRLKNAGGADVEVACLSKWGPVADQLVTAGVTVTALGADNPLSMPAIVWRLARLIRAGRIETVFSFLIHANTVAAVTSRLCPGVRWIQSIQTTQSNPRWHWHAQSLAQYAAEQIVVPSKSVADWARDWSGVPDEKIVVIPNAVEPSDYAAVVNAGRDAHGQSANFSQDKVVRYLGFIGRLDPIKRIPDLLSAMAILAPSIHLHIFGDGVERNALESMIEKLGLSNRVTLHGTIANPLDGLGKIELLVLPSQAEGFGLVLIEAMAAGVAVVATDVPGIRDVVRRGKTGLLVPVASPAGLAEAIVSLLNDDALRQTLTENASKDVRARFSWDVVLPLYLKLLR